MTKKPETRLDLRRGAEFMMNDPKSKIYRWTRHSKAGKKKECYRREIIEIVISRGKCEEHVAD